MALTIRKSPPPIVPLPLGSGAFIRIRPASSSDVDDAATLAGNRVAALLLGGEDARGLTALMPSFDFGDLVGLGEGGGEGFADRLRAELGLKSGIERLTERLVLVELVKRCAEAWSGLQDESGADLPLHEGAIALVLEDPVLRNRLHNAVYARYYAEADEKNGLAALPNGGAAAAANTANPAELSEAPAPAVAEAQAASDVLK